MTRKFRKLLTAAMTVTILLTSVLGSQTIYASDEIDTSDETSGYVQVSTEEDIEKAVQIEDNKILVTEGDYSFDSGLSFAEGVTLVGDGTVTFDFGSVLMSGQSSVYISNADVTLNNIVFKNDSSAGKPVIKIQSSGVSLIDCTIVNAAKASALVLHAATGTVIRGGSVSNTYSAASNNSFAVIQVNAGSEVQILDGTSIVCAHDGQPHIVFSYSSSSSTDYSSASTLKFDESIIFGNGYSDCAAIYNEAPNSLGRSDTVIIITDDYGEQTLQNQEDSDSTEGLNTQYTGWYCYNLAAWSIDIFGYSIGYDGYLYANTADSDIVSAAKAYAYSSFSDLFG